MIELIIGPTCSGKTTYIERHSYSRITFAHSLESDPIPDEGALHYNLLHHALKNPAYGARDAAWSIHDDLLLKKILESGKLMRAVVLVAPVNELFKRASVRVHIEADSGSNKTYPGIKWISIFEKTDFYRLYEKLFDALEAHAIPYTVLYSSAAMHNMLRTDRVFSWKNLEGVYLLPPSTEAVAKIKNTPGMEYQSVRLPGGEYTPARGYSHLQMRDKEFSLHLDQSMIGRSVLDVGCALGGFLFTTERYGGQRLVGLEPKDNRHAAALKLKNHLSSHVEIIKSKLEDAPQLEAFDDVLALNVVHHVKNIHDFLERLVSLTRSRLFIEFPLLLDPRFLSHHKNLASNVAESLDKYPLVGVSSSKVDQSFVFTRTGIRALLAEHGDFEIDFKASKISARAIAVCHRRY